MLPNLVVIGARRCGTSSLYFYLGSHSEITMSREKELMFFVDPERWARGVGWYESCFAGASTPVRGEASPQYPNYPENPDAAERMHSVIPEAKLIYLVGDPIERILSHYVADYADGAEKRPLAEALMPVDTNKYVAGSSYHLQLEQYVHHYPADQIFVLSKERLSRERRSTPRRGVPVPGRRPRLRLSQLRPGQEPLERSAPHPAAFRAQEADAPKAGRPGSMAGQGARQARPLFPAGERGQATGGGPRAEGAPH
jgi:hypothetical protein